MKPSLIISTYNSPQALKACLESVLWQTMQPHEVLIADDGSTDSTPQVIEEFRAKVTFPVVHVWQPNEGFRLATIRNKAIAQATGDYILQIDGDILLHPQFIADHASCARPGHFACGSRVLLDKELTERMFDSPQLPVKPWSKGVSNRKNAVRSPWLASMVNRLAPAKLKYRGCNMAFWRADLMAVNGYDESYCGWGCEDHDLVARLMNSGVHPLQIRHMAVCFHMWHPSSKKADTFNRNNELLGQTRRERRTWCDKGVNRHSVNISASEQ